ncbi:MAG TPA: DUF58 domain-containing protein [bacterium]|nr:DUF58 domain-containing protein [bacterium]
MQDIYNKYLNPENLIKLKDCQIIARLVAKGVITGKHRSLVSGINLEFNEYREYAIGDSLRNIDWKAYARKDKLYIKKYIEETNLSSYIVLDISKSMAYKTASISKYEFSIMLASALAFLLILQRDLTGLILFNEEIKKIINLSNKKEQIFRLLNELLEHRPAEKTNFGELLNSIQPLLKKRTLFIVISDFLSNINEILNFIIALKKAKNEVFCFHILEPTEINGPTEDGIYFDLETNERLNIDCKYIQREYKNYFENYIKEIKAKFNLEKIYYQLFNSSEDFVLPLRFFLDKLKRV